MAFLTGLLGRARAAFDPNRLALSQALLAGDYEAAAQMTQRLRRRRAEHERARMAQPRRGARHRVPDGSEADEMAFEPRFGFELAAPTAPDRQARHPLPPGYGDGEPFRGQGPNPADRAHELQHFLDPAAGMDMEPGSGALPDRWNGDPLAQQGFAPSPGDPDVDETIATEADMVFPLPGRPPFAQHRLVAYQEGFDRQLDHRIARQRARETGRDWWDIWREMRGLPSRARPARGLPPRARPVAPRRIAEPARTGRQEARAPKPPYDPAEDARVFREKLRRGGGLNGMGYIPGPDDPNDLARAIYAESHAIPGDDAAIGWATINRVGREGFQPTLSEVIHAPGQFAIVAAGNPTGRDHPLWTETEHPERLTGARRQRWLDARKVAEGILSGQIPDPTGGATRFFASDRFDPDRPQTAPGDFGDEIDRRRIRPSKFRSTSTEPNRQYFWIETAPPRPLNR